MFRALLKPSRPTAAERVARRQLVAELADYTAEQRTELTLLATQTTPASQSHVVGILRAQAQERLLRVN